MDYVFLGLYQIFAFFIQGVTGFGSTVLSAPFHTTVLGPTAGTAFATLLCQPTLIYLGIKEIKNVAWKDFGKIVALCAPGVIIGNILLKQVDANYAKVAIGGIVTFIAIMNIYRTIIVPLVLKREFNENAPDTPLKKAMRYIALVVGGIVHGAFTIGGPLITVYTLEAVKDKEKFRNTMTWVWIVLNLYNSFSHYRSGYFSNEMWSAFIIGAPLAILGLLLGMKCLSKINKITFLRIVYVVLLFVGGNMLYGSLMAIL
ncbi:hypothetical protein AN640_05505 [Candidatus Epulonipiscium fishelsonii]|uniref:Uncharacterized protein n=1 Tax=Candidatus Epulonipiscium fishelsonii TaxID=77094 RepID=A0ACC8XIE7_9FIRM|nr:hypothetical protein AN640_05505 [Epulopiscium sp. SCG-D08WGA-EpuloA1]